MTIAATEQGRIRARRAGFLSEVREISVRALRSVTRDAEGVIPALIFPVFWFAITVGALQTTAEMVPGFDYKECQLPVAIIFAVTGISRAVTVVTNIQTGYFDRLTLTPVNRLAFLFGMMVADFALVIALTLPVLLFGFALGVGFETGPLGVVVFILIAGLWGLAYTGFPYAIALKTGNPAPVNSSFLLFLPFVFLTTVFLPEEAMTGWMATAATYNPVTYLLDALRSLVSEGWNPLGDVAHRTRCGVRRRGSQHVAGTVGTTFADSQALVGRFGEQTFAA
jgi:ABC-2 type transport system permease protein